MNPTSPDLLRESAMPGCVNCNSSGRTRGYSGGVCPCIVRCGFCDSPIPRSQMSDEHEPRRVDGLPACDCCHDEANPMERAS